MSEESRIKQESEDAAPESVENQAPPIEPEEGTAEKPTITSEALREEGFTFLGHLGEAGLDGAKALGTGFVTEGIGILKGWYDKALDKETKG